MYVFPVHRVNQVYNQFKAEYPGITPTIIDTDEPQRSYNQLFAKYMNNRLGFGKQAAEYLDFLNTCSSGNAACSELSSIVDSYTAVRTDGVNHYGDDDVLITNLQDVVSNGVLLPSASVRAGNFGFFTEQSIRPRSGNSYLCFNDSYAIEWKFKYPQSGTNVGTDFYITATNFPGAIFQMIKTGPNPGLYLANFAVEGSVNGCSNWGYYNNAADNPCINFPGTNQSSILAIPGVNALDEWATIRMGIKGGKYQLYCNGRLIFEIARNATNPLQWSFSQIAFLRCKDFSIDWVKIYGDNDALVYNEDFNDPIKPAFVTGNKCLPGDCQSAFASYYNQQKGTSLTFDQIDALYNSSCGKHLDVCTASQGDNCNRSLGFIKTYTTATGSTNVNDMVQTADGGYALTGTTSAFGVKGVDAYITKVNRLGEIQWSKTFGKDYDDYLWHIKNTTDGGFVAVGVINSVGLQHGQIWVLKIDQQGNTQWSKSITDGNVYGDVGGSIIQTSDGGYAVTAYYQFQPSLSDWLLIKLSASGDILWNKRFGSNNSDQPGGLLEEGDSLVLTALHYSSAFSSPFTYYDGILMKVSKTDGTPGMVKTYDIGSKSNWFIDLSKTATGYSIFTYLGSDFNGSDLYGNMLQVAPNGDPIRSVKVDRANPMYPITAA